MDDNKKMGVTDFALHSVKVLSALMIGVLFVLMLMVATAQQQVTSQMLSEGLTGGYDSALMLREDVASKEQQGIALTDDDQKIKRSFSAMDTMVGFGLADLVYLSPPLLQLLLTFVSGLFGGLLVTLVLIVYPSNQILSVADARPVTRTFLGGLIALCVYIVLLGGTAVLGSSSTEHAAGTNYMAFAGIGILAGMYSDRVAGWLSKRADEFFKQ